MTQAFYRRAYEIFTTLADLEPQARSDALDAACDGDDSLRSFVERLLNDDDTVDPLAVGLDAMVRDLVDVEVDPQLDVGSTVEDRLEVLAPLGRGGAASVWQVRDLDNQRLYALKVLRHPVPAFRERMAREQRFQRRVRHRHVVAVRDWLEVDGRPALLMELVDGANLRAFREGNPLGEAQVDAIALGVLAGVQAIHDSGIVHRDIKPANVLLAEERGKLVAKVADFGIARGLGSEIPGPALTQSGALLGTLPYMAPEQIRDPRQVDPRTDVWAVGCVLYFAIAGHDAFGGADNGEVIQAVLAGRPPGLPDGIPDRWRAAIDAALKPNLADRVASCAELRRRWMAPPGVLLQAGVLPAAGPHAPSDSLDLPVPRNRFVGRARQLADLAEILTRERLVTLLGPGGIGKTRLALEVGRSRRADWPDGVILVPLADADTVEGVLHATAGGLGVALRGTPRERVAEALAERGKILLVLDNFEQLVGCAADLVAQWLDAAPLLTVLVTSRAPLRLYGERYFPLELLDEDDAVELFAERAREATFRFELDDHRADVVRLVNRLDRLPLAIELAAARSRSSSPASLLGRIGRRFDLLATRARDVPERQRTLRATLQWSWDLLGPAERTVLAQVSLFEGGFTIEAANGVVRLDSDSTWVEDVLAELVDNSLLTVEDDRLQMLVSVQKFAREKLEHRERVEQRHGEWFAALPPRERHREHENLVVAARRAMARSDEIVGSRCADLASQNYMDRGPFQGGIALIEPMLAQTRQPEPRLRLLRMAGELRSVAGDHDEARGRFEEVLGLARQAGEEHERHVAATRLGDLLRDNGAYAESRPYYEEASEAARATGAAAPQMTTHLRLGTVAYRLGDHAEAESQFQAALALSRGMSPSRGVAAMYGELATFRLVQGRQAEARAMFHKAIDLCREVGDTRNRVVYLLNFSMLAHKDGRLLEAAERLREARSLVTELGNPLLVALSSAHYGRVACDRGLYDEASRHLEEALEVGRVKQNGTIIVEAQRHLATVRFGQGRLDEAESLLAELLERTSGPPLPPTVYLWLGRIHEARGQLDLARSAYLEGLTVAHDRGTTTGVVQLLAACAPLRDTLEEGARDLDEAEAQCDEASDVVPRAWVACGRAHLELRFGHSERARAFLDEAAVGLEPVGLTPDAVVARAVAHLQRQLPKR